MIECFLPDSFLLPHVPWGSRCLLIKAMCILSLPVQLLKPESSLENISPNCTVLHRFFLTPPDNLFAYCLFLFGVAPVGVWGLNDFTQEFIIRNENASFQIYNTGRPWERFFSVAGEIPNVRGLFWPGMETPLALWTLLGKHWEPAVNNPSSADPSTTCQGGHSGPGVSLGHLAGNVTGILALPRRSCVSQSSWKSLRSGLSFCPVEMEPSDFGGLRFYLFNKFLLRASVSKSSAWGLSCCHPGFWSSAMNNMTGVLLSNILATRHMQLFKFKLIQIKWSYKFIFWVALATSQMLNGYLGLVLPAWTAQI